MRLLRNIRLKVRSLFRRSDVESDLNDELEDYLAHQTERYIAGGLSLEDARQAALRALGSPLLLVREDVRATWSWNWLETLLRDIRIGVRTLRRTPAFSIIAVAVMALCVGASTSLFTLVHSVLLKPLPFHDPDRLVMIYERYHLSDAIIYDAVSPGDYYDWREQTHGFEDMAAWDGWQFNLSGEHAELPEAVTAAAGTWNFFPLLGVKPVFGRTFTEAEDQPGRNVVMLTWSIFERRFAGDPGVLGRQIHLDSKSYTVIGVLPAWFSYPEARVQVWVPYSSVTWPQYLQNHAFHQSRVVARMKPGVSLASAISPVAAVQYRLHAQHPHEAVCEGVVPRTLTDDLAQDVRKPLIILMCAVTCMLLIGCLNIANLLVARGAARRREVAIRGALGAPRFRLIREHLTESLLVCFAGGMTGVLLSVSAIKWLAHAWKDLPSATEVDVDVSVLVFACSLVFIAALLSGLLPAVSSTGKSVLAGLKTSSRSVEGSLSRTGLRKTLLTVEISVTVVLLIAAGLLLKSFVRLRTTNVGCVTDHLLTMSYSLPGQKYDSPAKVIAFHQSLLERLRAMPGGRGVALGMLLPGAGRRNR